MIHTLNKYGTFNIEIHYELKISSSPFCISHFQKFPSCPLSLCYSYTQNRGIKKSGECLLLIFFYSITSKFEITMRYKRCGFCIVGALGLASFRDSFQHSWEDVQFVINDMSVKIMVMLLRTQAYHCCDSTPLQDELQMCLPTRLLVMTALMMQRQSRAKQNSTLECENVFFSLSYSYFWLSEEL